MYIDDEFTILDHFNEACKGVASLLRVETRLNPFEVELDVIIPDIDDWWLIQIENKFVSTRYAEYMLMLDEGERETYLLRAREAMAEFPDYNAHLSAMKDRSSEPLLQDYHYLPHFVTYMDDMFHDMQGFQDLKKVLDCHGQKPHIYLTPKEKHHEDLKDNGNLHGWGNYCLVLVTERVSGTPTHDIPAYRH